MPLFRLITPLLAVLPAIAVASCADAAEQAFDQPLALQKAAN